MHSFLVSYAIIEYFDYFLYIQIIMGGLDINWFRT
jgi:hypothetical protein